MFYNDLCSLQAPKVNKMVMFRLHNAGTVDSIDITNDSGHNLLKHILFHSLIFKQRFWSQYHQIWWFFTLKMLRISRSSVGDGNVGFTQTTCSPLWWWCDRCDRSIRSYEFYDTKLLVPTAATFQYPCFPCFTLMHTPQLQAMTYMLLMQIPNICLHIRTQCGSGGRPVGRLADGSWCWTQEFPLVHPSECECVWLVEYVQ